MNIELNEITIRELAEGYQEDFYPNGNVRIRGNFSEGNPKDSLVLFYSNGAVKTRSHFPLKELIIENYDSLNHLIKVLLIIKNKKNE